MARFIEVKYGGIRQTSRRKNGSFMSEYPARRAPFHLAAHHFKQAALGSKIEFSGIGGLRT
jgi:hypothetical protein